MPNRILKESICTSADVDRMDLFTEVFFYRLIVCCDDYGRMDGRTAILRAKLFPLKEGLRAEDIEAALQLLMELGCVARYQVDGLPYLYLPAWEKHQRVRNLRAKYPPPPEDAPQSAADGGRLPPQSKPIQSEAVSASEAIAEAEALPRLVALAGEAGLPGADGERGAAAAALLATYPAEWLEEAIRRTAVGSVRTWRYVQGILSSWARKGGIDAPAAGTGGAPKQVSVQRYRQREYDADALNSLFDTLQESNPAQGMEAIG